MLFFDHHGHYHLFRMSEMKEVFWTHGLTNVGAMLVSVFVPIYLLNLGYTLSDVLLFAAFMGLFSIPLQYPASQFISRFGANRGMAIGAIVQIGYFLLLLTLPDAHWPLALLALTWAIHRVLYWPAYHANFSKASAHKAGKEVGLMNALVLLGHGAAPAIGGLVADRVGIGWLYGVAIGIFVVAVLPLVGSREITARRPLRPRSVPVRKILRDLVSNAGGCVDGLAQSVVWPLLVFLVVSNYAGVGVLTSIVTLSSIAISIYVGRHEAARGERHYLREGLGINTIAHTLRLMATTPGHIFGINAAAGIAQPLYRTAFFTKLYQHANEERRNEYIYWIEVVHEITWAAFFLILWGLSFALDPRSVLLLGIAAAIPATLVINRIR